MRPDIKSIRSKECNSYGWVVDLIVKWRPVSCDHVYAHLPFVRLIAGVVGITYTRYGVVNGQNLSTHGESGHEQPRRLYIPYQLVFGSIVAPRQERSVILNAGSRRYPSSASATFVSSRISIMANLRCQTGYLSLPEPSPLLIRIVRSSIPSRSNASAALLSRPKLVL